MEEREGGKGWKEKEEEVLPHKAAALSAEEGRERKKKKERKGCRAVLHKTVSVKAEKNPSGSRSYLSLNAREHPSSHRGMIFLEYYG